MGSLHHTGAYRRLRAGAVDQHGVITLGQLRALGIGSSTVSDWCRAGRLCHLARGVYAVPELVDRWSCLRALCRSTPGAVASHRAAARLWNLDGVDVDVVEVTVRHQARPAPAWCTAATPRRRRHHRGGVDPLHRRDPHPGRPRSGGAARRPGAALESALRRRLTTVPRLQWRSSCLARRGRRGPAALQAVLRRRPLGAAPTDSELETRFLQCLRAAGVVQPVRQHPVRLPGGRVVRRTTPIRR